ncbi:hypothetical protein J6590_010560 [Homalodisca vitripennis]|nr:hypothetical protein J6590_010560 [Homalodisca vitripennis]
MSFEEVRRGPHRWQQQFETISKAMFKATRRTIGEMMALYWRLFDVWCREENRLTSKLSSLLAVGGVDWWGGGALVSGGVVGRGSQSGLNSSSVSEGRPSPQSEGNTAATTNTNQVNCKMYKEGRFHKVPEIGDQGIQKVEKINRKNRYQPKDQAKNPAACNSNHKPTPHYSTPRGDGPALCRASTSKPLHNSLSSVANPCRMWVTTGTLRYTGRRSPGAD